MKPRQQHYDVAIAGGGPAGLAAGLFTARYGLRTVIFDRGRSSLRMCAHLDNYLGFPGGIDAATFLDLARAQARDAGCEIVRERVTAVERDAGGRFTVHTCEGTALRADLVVAASPDDVGYLRTLGEPALFDETGQLRAPRDTEGRTIIDGLYLAGLLAGVESEAMISAGQAAQVALALIRDRRRAEGQWEALARYLDWQVWAGLYENRRWAGQVRAYFAPTAPADLDAERAREMIEQWMRRKRAQQLDKADAARRRERGRRMLREHLAQVGARQAHVVAPKPNSPATSRTES